jgi:glycosyltransferase involved in cell wall biosynthesis
VSIGLPVYNRARYVGATIESILAQTFSDFELIISDNASTDGTAEICQEYGRLDKRIIYYRNVANIGAAKNFNRVFELATGEYFKWVASDDICLPTFIERCVDALDHDRGAVLAYPRAKCIDEHGQIVPRYVHFITYVPLPDDPVGRFRCLVGGGMLERNPGIAAVYVFGLIRSAALKKTPLIRSHLDSDVNLLVNLALMGRFIEIPEYLNLLRRLPEKSLPARDYWHALEMQQNFFDPSIKSKPALWLSSKRRRIEYVVSILRAPLSSRQKVTLLVYLTHLAFNRLATRVDRTGSQTAEQTGNPRP